METLTNWDVENDEFWRKVGKKIANRNLLVSVPALLCAFAVWIMWSVIAVQMKSAGFPFDDSQLFVLTSVAGFSGATLRIPNSFLVAISGGKNVIGLSTALLLVPAVGAGICLQDVHTPFWVFVVLAAFSGVGGGNFASSMSNISAFFPKKVQGTALGINAGVGNLGVSVTQFLLPWVSGFALFGALGGNGVPLVQAVGAKSVGTPFFVQNSGWVWVPILSLCLVGILWGMNNLPIHKFGSVAQGLLRAAGLMFLGFLSAAVGLYLMLVQHLNIWIVLVVTIALTLFLMNLVPGQVHERLKSQFAIFKDKHNWIMTLLYIMTFGSFIGFSQALPLSIKVIFGTLPDGTPNANGPNPLAYAWIAPFVGSLVRPVGGWLSDKIGGAKVTQWITVVMIVATLLAAGVLKRATASATPEEFFPQFFRLFLVILACAGLGNGSTFQMVPVIFKPALAGPVLGWTSAVAAYGAFVIPKVMGDAIKAKTPENALYGFAVFFALCLVLNWWYYARSNAEIKC